MELKGKKALITGASAGIGKAIAEAFAKEGADLILIARRKKISDELAEELIKSYGIKCITIELDVRKYEEVKSKLEDIDQEWKNVDILVNNAGLARGLNKIQDGVLDDWEEMIDTNIKGLLYVTKTVLPWMLKRNDGYIINIGSLAGEEVYPAGNVYCATKFAVKALSKGMIIDLNGTGIRVTNISPGLTETEFSLVRFRGDAERAKSVYQNYKPLTAEDIARVALFCVTQPKHVCIQEILVTPTAQATTTIVHKNLG